MTEKVFEIPEYWQEHISIKKKRISELKKEIGADEISFALLTDFHFCENEKHSPAIIKNLVDEGIVSRVIMCGDVVSGKGICSSDEILSEIDGCVEMFSPVKEVFLMVEGNHDRAFSEFSPPEYYVQNLPQSLFSEHFFANDRGFSDRVFDDDGNYYYVDDKQRKIRYIVMNSQDVPNDKTYDDGKIVYNSMLYFGFRQKQLTWFAEKALKLPDNGWCAVAFAHAVLPSTDQKSNNFNYSALINVVKAFSLRKKLSCEVSNSCESYNLKLDLDFSEYKGEFLGFFGGHTHTDSVIYKNSVLFVQTDTDASYENYLKLGYRGSILEHAIDIFTVDKLNRRVSVTRIGRGEDREFVY